MLFAIQKQAQFFLTAFPHILQNAVNRGGMLSMNDVANLTKNMIEAEKSLIWFVISLVLCTRIMGTKFRNKTRRNGILEEQNRIQSLQINLLAICVYLLKPIQQAQVLFPVPFHKGPQYPD